MSESCQQYMAFHMRSRMTDNAKRFPFPHYLQIFYNDALTYNPVTKKGGLIANFAVSSAIRRDPRNRHLQLLQSELIYHKKFEEGVTFDKLSLSDYVSVAAFLAVKESEGPNVLGEIVYGRKDAKDVSECGSIEDIPNESNYRSNLLAKGFTDDEIVALASVESFGIVKDPKEKDISIYPKLSNFFYKEVLSP